jgi:predicted metal-dependent phosphoesterase TrpH
MPSLRAAADPRSAFRRRSAYRSGAGSPVPGHSVIDLHLHTTASDGTLAPRDLAARAASARLTVISVTDHDTVAGLPEASRAAAALGLTFVPGIEITAVEDGRDVHILGYYFDAESAALAKFLTAQREDRLRRVREMCDRLASMGLHVLADDVLESTSGQQGRSVGRPAIADALVRAGHARDRDDAFTRLIGRGSPAYVPRRGVSSADVIDIIGQAGGIASLAHPGLAGIDNLIPFLASRGLAAIEARHSDHTPEMEAHYRGVARRLGLALSGGSDYHGDGTSNAASLGLVTLDAADFAELTERAISANKRSR